MPPRFPCLKLWASRQTAHLVDERVRTDTGVDVGAGKRRWQRSKAGNGVAGDVDAGGDEVKHPLRRQLEAHQVQILGLPSRTN